MMVLYMHIYSCSLRSPLASLATLDPRSKVGGVILKTSDLGFLGPPKNSLREFLLTPSTMSKRSFGAVGGYNKSTRMVGGRKLTYRPSAPVPGSYRSRVSAQAIMRSRARVEVKGVDFALTQASLINTTNTNGGMQCVNLIAPGSGSFNRVGRKVQLQSLRFKGWISLSQPPSTALQAGTVIRMALVLDKQPTGTIPSFDAIFGWTDQVAAEASTMFSPPRYDNMERFTILRDKCIDINPNTSGTLAVTASSTEVSFDEYITLKDLSVTYGGQSSPCTIADISTNALYLVWRSANATGVVNTASIGRLRYVDI